MNKKILSAMLSVAILFAAGSAFVSCKDYDDDIKNLQGKIDGLDQRVKAIEDQIKNGALVVSATPITGGVHLELSNGQKYDIVNGKDGADGKDGSNGKDDIFVRMEKSTDGKSVTIYLSDGRKFTVALAEE